VACRSVSAKRTLIRIVRGTDGTVSLDPTGKKAGRGAYLHATRACWERGITRRALDHALKVTLTPADRAALLAHAETFPTDEEAADSAPAASPA
jgi:predicted RNA-binding protein YlxR (DUF448 family)